MSREASAATIRLPIFLLIVELLNSGGEQGKEFLKRHDLDVSRGADFYDVMPLARYIALFEEAAVILNEPSLGVKLGRGISPASLGPLGLVVVGQSTLRSALQVLTSRIAVLQSGTMARLSETSDLAIFDYHLLNEKIWPRRQDAEFSIVATCAVIRAIVGVAWRPLDVHFEHRRGLSARALEAYFGVTPRFGKASNSIVFSRSDLDQITDEANRTGNSAYSVQFLERHLTDLMIRVEPDDIVEKVATMIDRRLGMETPTLSSIAVDLGLSARTLQRELADRTVSYGQILRQCRLKRARALLEQGELDLDEIAGELGYSDSTAFSRAFRQWTNVTPRRFIGSENRKKTR